MKPTRFAFTLLAGLIVGAATPVVADEHHHHHHDAPTKLALNQGKQWATDAPLRQAMTAMRAALAAKLHAIHGGNLGKEESAALGKEIESQVGTIVSQCQLEPKADAMLHVVIADLVVAADILQGKAAGKPAEAALRAVDALNSYGVYFKHPGWAKL